MAVAAQRQLACLPALEVGAYTSALAAYSSNATTGIDQINRIQQGQQNIQRTQQRQQISLATEDAKHAVFVDNQKVQCLSDYIAQGPLSSKIGPTVPNVEDYALLGTLFAQHLDIDPKSMDQRQMSRIFHLMCPVYYWTIQQMHAFRQSTAQSQEVNKQTRSPLVVGISAPQGSGKTTLVNVLERVLNSNGIRAASVSLDDFYLTYEGQCSLGEQHQGNELLKYRGNAGSHDVDFGANIMSQLKQLRSGQTMQVPRYNKAAREGRGDRSDVTDWPTVTGPVDVVLYDGWMAGFSPIDTNQVKQIDPQLVQVNQYLEQYEKIDQHVDCWIVMKVDDVKCVYNWRLEAEERMKSAGKTGLSEAQVADFVARFMPSYKAYLPGLHNKGPRGPGSSKMLNIMLDQGRSVVHH